ncbi:dual specificity phosphatase, catalytic domain-containing protein [Hirsutella rhossiliensis]|uniref:Dual specificity phosphatase, catalytic domain-containing protein n=1 Tax=Hirsutella rhossiliensis TaxID=111463 RepID=A0A9P8SNX2_9HYPO|nr:dual specificity phosphatase, catalytic domain-containing protein [Hirsutella rhossiliensis]KAH0968330.1 dual specificity phosphatase, catalytic domain-containing protein [Hirsutella rhossiliensis]
MATITLSRPLPPHSATPDIASSITSPRTLEDVGSSSATHSPQCPAPIPNKHVPVCPTGPPKAGDLDTPPASPQSSDEVQQSSLLYPPDGHTFFMGRRRSPRRTPSCLRGVTLVKANGDLSTGRLKGAVAPDEFLRRAPPAGFIEADPTDGFSVRNFQIQPAKMAFTSDIVVYGDDPTEVHKAAWDISAAQVQWRELHAARGQVLPEYNTFVCTSTVRDFEENYPDLISIDTKGSLTGRVLDFVHQERREMWDMTKASEISPNVFMGPTPESQSPEEQQFDVLIECCDFGRLNPAVLQLIAESMDEALPQSFLDFPSSGSILPPTWSHDEADGILETCRWIYHLSHGTCPKPRDASTGRHDTDSGELSDREAIPVQKSTMLGIAYFSYSTGRPVPDAWLHLHTSKRRNFFAYPTDVALLTAIAPRLLRESPLCAGQTLLDITNMIKSEPRWLPGLDGSLPSRILDYLYLGNLGHANNPDLLTQLGIKQLLSVGEEAAWRDGAMDAWGRDNVCVVQGVQDNGIDPLTDEFARCLEFIDRGRRKGTATLVHCRVGVSRSATICIVEVMRALSMTFPRAYCFVRARRLNVIIQPHLRFAYELLRWEEWLQQNGDPNKSMKRELEWGEIAREIALMNRPYSR